MFEVKSVEVYMARPKTPIEERFWSKVNRTDTCWFWMAHIDKDGYGAFSDQTNYIAITHRAHQWAWILTHGEIPKDLCVLHKRECNNRLCVNPDHLYLGDSQDNADDRVATGRQRTGERCSYHKITVKDVRDIRFLRISGRMSPAAIAEVYNIGRSTVSEICNRTRWKAVD
jgi:hypothetical protein